MKEGVAPEVRVGVLTADEIKFSLKGNYRDISGMTHGPSTWKAELCNGKVVVSSDSGFTMTADEFTLKPEEGYSASFVIHSVVIGVDFHWEREEDQEFPGSLSIITEKGMLVAVNVLPVEDYLISVISSEMSATSSEELLKAHAVISRGWLLAQIDKNRELGAGGSLYQTSFLTDDEIVRWYDREDHINYDVCADDHCQRYQGITRVSTPEVTKAVAATAGEILVYDGSICDTRYYKCCGGVTELFENAWEPVDHPYLQKVVDNPVPPAGFTIDLENEESAVAWIDGNPDAFCNTDDREILSQVLNDYDQETSDFYRWKVTYTQSELSSLVRERTGIDFGVIEQLVPLTRGCSGRITRLRISGSARTMIIGKELEIRKALSKSHLYSSCFYVTRELHNGETLFHLHGAGWGHGVGLCQIGAAVMGAKGYSYREILMHYFRGATLERRY